MEKQDLYGDFKYNKEKGGKSNKYFTDFGTHVLVSSIYLLLKCFIVNDILESPLFKQQFLCGCHACHGELSFYSYCHHWVSAIP